MLFLEKTDRKSASPVSYPDALPNLLYSRLSPIHEQVCPKKPARKHNNCVGRNNKNKNAGENSHKQAQPEAPILASMDTEEVKGKRDRKTASELSGLARINSMNISGSEATTVKIIDSC